MGKKSGPAAPAAPDPVATAAAQGAANREAAITQANLNRINQVTPEGSLRYSIEGYNADGTPQYTQTQTYSDAEQRKYDQQNQVAFALNDTAVDNISRVRQAQATPFTYNGMTPLETSVGGGNPFQLQAGPNIPSLRYGVQGGGLQYGAGVGGVQGNVAAGPIQNQLTAGNVRDTVTPQDARTSAGVGTVKDGVQGGDLRTGAQGAGTAQGIDPSLAGRGVQQGLDYSGLTSLPGTENFGAEARSVADSVYAQAASRLDPRFQQSESDMRSRLAAQGITENSDAYRRELDNASRDRNDAYNQAVYSARQAGADEQSRLFGLSMSARQQGQNEANAQGQFTNNAQQQQYGQMLAAQSANQSVQGQNYGQNANEAAFYNQAQGQQFDQGARNVDMYNQAQAQQYGQRANEADLYNRAQGQIFGQNVAGAQLFNDAQGQAYDQRANNAAFYNQAQQQQFGQGMQNADLYNQTQAQAYGQRANEAQMNNAAQGQQFDQDAANVDLYNQAAQAMFNNGQSAAAFNNQAQTQYFNQDAANAAFNNQARQQQIQEAAYLRNMPLNDIAALLNGNQAQSPSFQTYGQVGVAAPDYQGLVQANFNAANQRYQQQQQSRSQSMGSIAGLAGTAASMFLSDRRFKENIKRIGTLANGLATYAFTYVGDKVQQFGVMAQEVLDVVPDAVHVEDGVMYVDYGRVY